MLFYKSAEETGDVAVIDIDVVRLNDKRFMDLKEACNSDEGTAMGAFLVQYDFSTVIQLHRGSATNHNAFTEYLNTLM